MARRTLRRLRYAQPDARPILGLPAVAAVFHVTWCLRHGIHPLTAEPRERYEQLRARRRTRR